jgi:starch synthase (maltosyl-transferring)
VKEWWEVVGRIGIDDVAPVVSGGRFPAKAVVGEIVPVRATVWREGHDAVAATLVVRYHGSAYPQLANGPATSAKVTPEPVPIETVVNPRPRITRHDLPMAMGTTPDVFHGQFTPDSVGLWTYRVDAWGDPIATWRKAVIAKLDAGQGEEELSNGCSNGRRRGCRASCETRSSRPRSCCESPAIRSPGPGQHCHKK